MIGMQSCSLIMNFSPVTPGYCLRHRKFICLGEGGEGGEGEEGGDGGEGEEGERGEGEGEGEEGEREESQQ